MKRGGASADNYKETGIAYDPMGNITALTRYQANTLIDQLSYAYLVSSNTTNQVQSIVDASGSNSGLVNGTTTYTYDPNGNTLSNTNTVNTGQNKSYTYNLLNLPLVVTVPTGTVTYTYDATGNKLRKVDVLSGVTKTTDYINGIEYDNSTTAIGFIQNEEGKAVPNDTGFDYVYYLGDNLGNTRVTFGTKTGLAVVYQQDDYYPFGLEINRTPYTPKNEYLYNRKELQEELGQYDYGARFYDPVKAQWTTVDPLAEEDRRTTPYGYTFDDPIRHTDPDGMFGEDANDEGGGEGCCDGHGPSTPAKVILVGGLTTAGVIITGAAPTGPGEVVAVPVAAVVATVTVVTAGIVWAWNAATSNSNSKEPEPAPQSTPQTNNNNGRAGKQERLKELSNDDKQSSANRGWLKQEKNAVDAGKRTNMRNPPGKDLAHARGKEAAKGYSYKHSNLQDKDLHRRQHKHDNNGQKNKENPN